MSIDRDRVRVIADDDRDYSLSLANVGSYGACSNELRQAYQLRLAALLPVNSTVTAVRSKPDSYNDTQVYLHPAASADTTKLPTGPSINEQLVAEGSASIAGVMRDASYSTVEEQVGTLRARTELSRVPYVNAIAAAENTAWEQRIGAIGACRVRLDQEAADRDRRNRELWGPDGKPGTDDDPKRNYPSLGDGSSSGGSSSGGRRCRGRWC